MSEANEPRRRRRHRLEAPPPPAKAQAALKPPAASGFRGTPTTQWSEWVLHASGSYYYRARYISYDETARVIPDGRNSIVSDNVGGYIHYQFMGFNDALMRSQYTTPTQTPELSTCSGTTPTSVEPSPFQPLPRIQYKTYDFISGPPAVDDRKMLMSGALLPPKPDNTYGKALVASKPRISRRKHHQQQQQHQQQPAVPKKKERKKLEVDKRQMNSNVKVSKWLDSL